MFSSVKDENVVKPPQIPTIKNNRKFGDNNSLLEATPAKNPIIMLPNRLTINVPTGIENNCTDKFKRATRKRNMLPINPPIPMYSSCFI